MRFGGRTVLVTGASRGLGAVLAGAFAAEGARVVVGYRVQQRKAGRVVAEIENAGGAALAVQLDVRDPASVAAAVRAAGKVDVLVNNAAITTGGTFGFDDAAVWRDVVETDLIGAATVLRAAVRPMIAAGGGVVVNVASVAGLRAQPATSAYAAAKGGLIALTRTLGAELAPRGVRVNAVVPGILDIGMAARLPHERVERWLRHVPLGRAGTAAEVAAATLFLASDDASYCVGQALVVDGGLSL